MGVHARQQYDHEEMHHAIRYLNRILEPVGISTVEASLRWLCYHTQLTPEDNLILGASKLSHLVENVEAIRRGPLPHDIVANLDNLWDAVRQQKLDTGT